MLILTRRISETLIIADDIKVTILDIRGGQVRIGIDAPADVAILRKELVDGNPQGQLLAEKPGK